MARIRLALLLMLLPFMTGCLAAVVAGGAAGAVGVNYTLTNIAYKTLNAPQAQVETAVKKAFNKMDIKLIATSKKEEGALEIKGATAGLDIYVELEIISSKTTKISVDARENAVVKDKATAAEIINQTEQAL